MVKPKLLLIGDGETAEMAYEYLSTDYCIEAFLVEKKYIKKTELFGIPVKALEDIETEFSNAFYKVFVAVSFVNGNKLRQKLYDYLSEKGYQFISYIHPSVIIGADVAIGNNCFILERVVLQRKVKIKNNVFIWSGSVVAHHTLVDDHTFIASGVMISGFCKIGKRAFLGVGSSIKDFIEIADDNIIGGGAFIHRNTESNATYIGVPGKIKKN